MSEGFFCILYVEYSSECCVSFYDAAVKFWPKNGQILKLSPFIYFKVQKNPLAMY